MLKRIKGLQNFIFIGYHGIVIFLDIFSTAGAL